MVSLLLIKFEFFCCQLNDPKNKVKSSFIKVTMKFFCSFGDTPEIVQSSPVWTNYNNAYDPSSADFLDANAYVPRNRLPCGFPAGPYPQNPFIGPAIGLERSSTHAIEQFRYNLCSQVKLAQYEKAIWNATNGLEREFECLLKGQSALIDVNNYCGMVFAVVENRFPKLIEENVPLYLDEFTQAIHAPFELGLNHHEFGFAGLMCVGFCKQMWIALANYNPKLHKLLGVFIMRTDSASADEYNKVVNKMRDELSERIQERISKEDILIMIEQVFGQQRRFEYVQELDRIHSASCREVLKLVDIGRNAFSNHLQMWFSNVRTRVQNGCSWLSLEHFLLALPCDLRYRILRYMMFPFRPIRDPPMVLRRLDNGDIAVYIVRIRLDGRMYVRSHIFTLTRATDRNGRQCWTPKAEQHHEGDDDCDNDEENYDIDALFEES